MGACGARRSGRQALLLGRRAVSRRPLDGEHLAGRVPHGESRRGRFHRHGTREVVSAQRLRVVRHGRQRLGMVRRLVSTGLLRRQPEATIRKARRSSVDPDGRGEPKRVQRGGSFLCSDNYCVRYRAGTRGQGERGHRLVPHRLPLRAVAALRRNCPPSNARPRHPKKHHHATLSSVRWNYHALASRRAAAGARAGDESGLRTCAEPPARPRANKVFKDRVNPHWLADNTRFWYRNDLAGGMREFILVNAVKGERRIAFDHARLAAALTKATGENHRATHLPLEELDFTEDGAILRFRRKDKRWRCDLNTYALAEDKAPAVEAPPRKKEPDAPPRRRPGGPPRANSPDRKWTVFVKDHNLHLREREDWQRSWR